MRLRWLSLSFATFLLTSAAFAEKPSRQQGLPGPAPSGSEERGPQGQPVDPEGKRGISPFMIKILKGNAAYAARDFPASIAAYREAIQDAPENPLGHYMLGQAQTAAENLKEAEASYEQGLRFSANQKPLHAKLLFVVADIRERQKQYAPAKQGWEAYLAYCEANPKVPCYPKSAEGRIKAIEKWEETEKQAAIVKERIKEREKELDEEAKKPAKK